ncbi:MAG: phosphatidate cytidylyltransferase [Pontimonas sp.]
MSEHPPSKKKFDPAQVGHDALEQFEAAVSEFEEQVRDVNARIDKRAGRPLWQAIVFGLLLGGVFVGSLFWLVELFVLFVTALVVFAVLELAGALTDKGRLRSRWPLVVVSAVMVPLAAFYGPEGQLWSLVGAIVLAVVIRAGRALIQPDSRSTTLSDIGVAVMVLAYIPFLAGFAVAVATSPGGVLWLFSGVVIVVCVDVAAYATGLSVGRTPLAPKISPKKTWEGFAGSLLAALLAGGLLGVFLLGLEWWQGIIVGALLLGSATLGDLIESLIKRDLGIKDISSWLPGHGGFLDRLDSMLPSMAMLYVLFQIFG